ncbi:MAG: CHASE2 domain-containing protein [Patescibacteria group bacterium]
MKRPPGGLILSGAALAAALAAGAMGLWRESDYALHDAFAQARLATAVFRAGRELPVVVAIDGDALREFGRWPWPRATLARLVHEIASGGPKAVGLDLLLLEPAPGDLALARALSEGRFILAQRLDLRRAGAGRPRPGRPETPAPLLSAAAYGLGFVDVFPDGDGIIRRLPAACGASGKRRLSLAAALAEAAGTRPRAWPDEIEPAIDLVPSAWPTVPAGEILSGRARPETWRGRPVLVGLTAHGVSADFYPVSVRRLGRVAGVYLHAYAFASLAGGDWLRPIPVWAAMLASFAASFGPWFFAGGFWRLAAGLAAVCTAVAAASLVLFLWGLWLAPMAPFAAAFVSTTLHFVDRAARQRHRARRLHAAFARYVSPQALRQIMAGPEPRLGGEAREITVLFADLRGFTAFAEHKPPEAVASALNEHLGLMSRIILASGGMVDKFMGDAVMGIFGAPLPDAEHRRHALAAAVAIQRALRRPGLLPAGIGVASGTAMVGNVGGDERLDYTAVGDAVNLAARLQEMAGPREILAGVACFDGAPGPVWEDRGLIPIRGRAVPARVYRLVMPVTEIADMPVV